jgi:hypothetical protein
MKTNNTVKIRRAMTNVVNELKRQETQLIKTAATDFLFKVKMAITSEKYADATWIYSPAYAEYKSKHQPNKVYWKFSDDLFAAISNVTISKSERFVGVPESARNGAGEKISKYALRLEYGVAGRQPARPVFNPSLDEYFEGMFQKRVDNSIYQILGRWM